MKAIPVGKISSSFKIECNSCETSYDANKWEQHEITVTEDSSWDDWLDAYVVSDTELRSYIECPDCDYKWNFDWRLFSVTDKEAVESAGIETSSVSNWECSECGYQYHDKEDADSCCT